MAVDYLELRAPDLGPAPPVGHARLLVAARVGATRLIDNIAVQVVVLLCVDVGNTEIALGLYADGDEDEARPPLVRDWRMHTEPRMTADELEVAVGALLGRRYAEQVTGVAALSTVPSLLRELKLLVERRAEPSVVVGPGRAHRRAAAGGQPARGRRRPGRLHPGRAPAVRHGVRGRRLRHVHQHRRRLGARASSSAARSPPASRSPWRRSPPGRPRCAPSSWWRPRSVIGKNTVECLQAGVLYGFAGQVDGLVRRILDELGTGPVTVIGTGGLAPLIVDESETITEHVPDLTLLGLRLAYLRNVRTTSVTMGNVNAPGDVSGRAAR